MAHRRSIFPVLACLSLASFAGIAANAQPARAAAAQVAPAKAFDALITGFEGDVMRAANAMPAEKYSFSPASLNIPGAKFDGVRTFAAEATHIAMANYSIAAAVSGGKPEVDVKALSALTRKDEVIAALTGSFAAAHKAVATLTVANQNDALGGGGSFTKASLAAYIAAHGFDHYGQMVEYLRMNGIAPPPPPSSKGD